MPVSLETGVHGGNPGSTGRTCELHAHRVGGGIQAPNRGGEGGNVLTTKPGFLVLLQQVYGLEMPEASVVK